ncbi:MAG TPA: regulator protein, partial [bacterium]|nr:regulator protein [bacterium]
MKKVFEAARHASSSLRNPPPTLRALIARLGATLGAEEGKVAAEELVSDATEDLEDAEGEGDAVVAAAHLRLASALERAGRKAEAAAEVDAAAATVA